MWGNAIFEKTSNQSGFDALCVFSVFFRVLFSDKEAEAEEPLEILTWKVVQTYAWCAHFNLDKLHISIKNKVLLNKYMYREVLLSCINIYWFHSPQNVTLSKTRKQTEEQKKISTEMIICHLFSTHAQTQAVTILKCIDGRAQPKVALVALPSINFWHNVYTECNIHFELN